jgi:hypothetical protein
MIYLRFTLLTMVKANKNGVKVELSGIPKRNLAFLGLDKVVLLSLYIADPPLAIFNSALLVTFLLILGNNFYNSTEFEGFKYSRFLELNSDQYTHWPVGWSL